MTIKTRDPQAKLRHIDACMLDESQYEKSAGFEACNLVNEAGAPVSLDKIDVSVSFCGRKFAAPIMISPMTGGIKRGAQLNEIWGHVAHQLNLPIGVGSQRIAIEQGDRVGFSDLRRHAKDAFIFANLGAANLTRANASEMAKQAIDMIEANAIFIHFNAIQEACQRGDTNFSDSLFCLEEVGKAARDAHAKVFAREVGFGLSKNAASRFLAAGVDGIDCSGAGGTSWSKVEAMCGDDTSSARLGQVFGEWGIPTAESIQNVRSVSKTLPLIASGGIRSGLDVAKAIALGADLCGMARPMLLAAVEGEAGVAKFIEAIVDELKVAMFGTGLRSLCELRVQGILASGPSLHQAL